MDWSKVKQTIGTIAPWIAGSFGTPAAGVAVGALCQVFGLNSQTATPQDVLSAVQGATAEQVIALRDADLKHKEFMAQLGYDSLDLLYKDVANARGREEVIKDKTPAILAAFNIIAIILLCLYVAYGQAPADAMRDGFWMIAGALITSYKDVFGYYFGSSSGSKEKDETIRGLSK